MEQQHFYIRSGKLDIQHVKNSVLGQPTNSKHAQEVKYITTLQKFCKFTNLNNWFIKFQLMTDMSQATMQHSHMQNFKKASDTQNFPKFGPPKFTNEGGHKGVWGTQARNRPDGGFWTSTHTLLYFHRTSQTSKHLLQQMPLSSQMHMKLGDNFLPHLKTLPVRMQ